MRCQNTKRKTRAQYRKRHTGRRCKRQRDDFLNRFDFAYASRDAQYRGHNIENVIQAEDAKGNVVVF